MASDQSDRRQFLKRAVALAGGAALSTKAADAADTSAQYIPHVQDDVAVRGARRGLDHMTHYTPLQDYSGIITPPRLHYTQQHSAEFPQIDASKHRLTIHGMVDRPLSFSMADLKGLPSVSRVHFLECQANSAPGLHNGESYMGLPVQFIHGMTSCSEWSGVPFSVLLNEAGLKKGASWLVLEGGDACKFTNILPIAKAMEDCFVAYGQNGDALRVEQGYPIRAIAPGWEAPFSVKYLTHIKVVDQPYPTWHEAMDHATVRSDLNGKSRWWWWQWGPKSVITRPSGGMNVGRGYVQITGLAWSGGGKVKKVEVSTDGGKSWHEAKLDGAVHSKAHTRFNYDWAWSGQEAMLLSRCTDETGDVQPSLEQLDKNWGIKPEDWKQRPGPSTNHMNAIQPWKVTADGRVSDAMFV